MVQCTAWLLSGDLRSVNILLADLYSHSDVFCFISFNTLPPWCLFKSQCSIENKWGASTYKMSLLNFPIKQWSSMILCKRQLFFIFFQGFHRIPSHAWQRKKIKGNSLAFRMRGAWEEGGSGAELWPCDWPMSRCKKLPGRRWGELWEEPLVAPRCIRRHGVWIRLIEAI